MKEAQKREFMHWEKLGKRESQMFCPAVPATASHIHRMGGGPPVMGNTHNGPSVCVGKQGGKMVLCMQTREEPGLGVRGHVEAGDLVGGGMAAKVETDGSGLASGAGRRVGPPGLV